MRLRLGPGPVFVYESITAARRWQVYATRAAFVLALLGALSVAWVTLDITASGRTSIQALAGLGEQFYYAIATVQIAVVLLAAPAATAGAICQDRARGSLTHMLVTDLSSNEIVLGKLAARLAPVFALVFAGLPVLAMASLLGGIIPETLATLTLISLAVATLGCAFALAVSVRAKKTHEVVIVVYAFWGVWVFGEFFWMIFHQLGLMPGSPDWINWLNPFILAWAPYAWPDQLGAWELAVFFTTTLGASALLVVYAVLRLRSEVRSAKASRRVGAWSKLVTRLASLRPGPTLDANPVLWREWHRNRPSRMTQFVWTIYYLGAAGGTAAFVIKLAGQPSQAFAMGLSEFTALHVTFGLLLVSLTAPTALAEVRGGLDVLLATPLSTASIVWAKWRGAYRQVPSLMVLPLLCSLLVAVSVDDQIVTTVYFPASGNSFTPSTQVVGQIGVWDRVAAALFPPLMLLAQGAAFTSLGLALAVWVRRVGRAMALSVTAYLLVSFGPLILSELGVTEWVLVTCGLATPTRVSDTGELVVRLQWLEQTIEKAVSSLSVIGGQTDPPVALVNGQFGGLSLKTIWAIEAAGLTVILAVAASLYGLTLLTFNRCLGRVPERRRKPAAIPTRLRPQPRVRPTVRVTSPSPRPEPAGVT